MNTSVEPQNLPVLSEVRRQLKQTFDEPNLNAFCLDNFPEVYDRFSQGMRKDEKITHLLDYCRSPSSRYERLISVLKEIGLFPISDFQRVPFTNRESEIAQLLDTYAPAYNLLDAPAGYGKTELLKELERRFRKKGWWSAYLLVEEKKSLTDLAKGLAKQLNLSWRSDKGDKMPVGLRLGGMLRREWSRVPKKGLVFLIDLPKRPLSNVVTELLQEFIPHVQECLRASNSFPNKHNPFRVVLSGRYLAAHIDTSDLKVIKLSPFDYKVIREAVKEADHDEDDTNLLAAHLLYLTGGHPGCISQAFERYQEDGIPPDRFFELRRGVIWEDMVSKYVDDVLSDLSMFSRNIRNYFDQWCVIRYTDYAVLELIIEDLGISDKKNKFDFADELTATYLLDWEKNRRFLRDGITRKLLTTRLWRLEPKAFVERCRQAQKVCVERILQSGVQRPEKWAIEYLFQSLQQYANAIHDPNKRPVIQDEFIIEVDKALRLLTLERGIPQEEWRTYLDPLKGAIQEDREFRFTVNYYLRDTLYNNTPYNKLERQIDEFFGISSD